MISKQELEERVRQIVKRLKSGERIEDSTLELKRELVTPREAARRLAGHANAAFGEPILWVIGVSEAGELFGVNQKDVAEWQDQVNSSFDEKVWPDLTTDLVIHFEEEGKSVVALLYATDRAPYVFLTGDNKHPHRLVPWRSGTSIREAKHSDLLGLLVPRSRLPTIRILKADLKVSEATLPAVADLSVSLYVIPPRGERVTLPAFGMSGALFIDEFSVALESFGFSRANRGSQALVSDPEIVGVAASTQVDIPLTDELRVHLAFEIPECGDRVVNVHCEMRRNAHKPRWWNKV